MEIKNTSKKKKQERSISARKCSYKNNDLKRQRLLLINHDHESEKTDGLQFLFPVDSRD